MRRALKRASGTQSGEMSKNSSKVLASHYDKTTLGGSLKGFKGFKGLNAIKAAALINYSFQERFNHPLVVDQTHRKTLLSSVFY